MHLNTLSDHVQLDDDLLVTLEPVKYFGELHFSMIFSAFHMEISYFYLRHWAPSIRKIEGEP